MYRPSMVAGIVTTGFPTEVKRGLSTTAASASPTLAAIAPPNAETLTAESSSDASLRRNPFRVLAVVVADCKSETASFFLLSLSFVD
jgi:hypothetical protein